jgi:hypothetical protein
MRRSLGLVLFLVLVVAACGQDPRSVATRLPEADGPLFVSTVSGLMAMNLETGRKVLDLRGAVATPDRSRAFAATVVGARTEVRSYSGVSGRLLGRRTLSAAAGQLEVRLASQDGRRVALMPPRSGGRADPHLPEARAQTTIVVADASDTGLRTFHLKGNFEPEAFMQDGSSLALIEYLPPENPQSYQIQKLNIPTGAVTGIRNVESGSTQHKMAGVARTSVMSAAGDRLYTLYVGAERDYAFVHVLDLAHGYTHCLFLPKGMGLAPGATALAVSPDGRTLYAVDHAAGQVVAADTEKVEITRQANFTTDPNGIPAAVVDDGGRLFTATGTRLFEIGTDLRVLGTWRAPQEVVQIAAHRDRLALVGYDRVVEFDPVAGRPVRAEPFVLTGEDTPAYSTPTELLCAC